MIDFLAQGALAGVLREMDIRLMVALICGSVTVAAKLQLSGGVALTEADVEQAIQSCWDGMRLN